MQDKAQLTAAEQAAWQAGLDEGRAQAAANQLATQHPDDAAVDALTSLMKAKLAKQRDKGYGGWDDTECSPQHLSNLLRGHVEKGDPVDVANFCAFLSARGEGIAPQAAPAAVAEPDERAAFEAQYRHLDLSQEPDAWGHERYKHDAISLAWEAWQARAALAATPAAWAKPVSELLGHISDVLPDNAFDKIDTKKWNAVSALVGAATPAAAAPVVTTIPDAAYCALQYVEHALAAIANREELVEGTIERVDTIGKASKRAKAALTRLQAVAHHFNALEESPAAPVPVVLPEPDAAIKEVMDLVSDWGEKSHLSGEAQLDAHNPEATQSEYDYSDFCQKNERTAWTAIESKLRALLATTTRLVLDYPWRDRLLDGRELVRDQQGFAEHPELPLLDEGMKPRAFFAALGVEMKHTMAEDDLSMDEYDAMNDAVNWSAWAPRPPIGDAWNLVAIFDTEDGPAAWWARAQETTPPAAQDAREFWGVIASCGEGVFFKNEADARWTQTGHGSGSDGFGVPTIGEAFRESYEDDALDLVRVHIVAGPAAKGE